MPSNNKEYQKAYIRQHYLDNKEYYKLKSKRRLASISQEQRMFENKRTQCRREKIPFDLEMSDIVIPDVCPIFKTPFILKDRDHSPSIDRVIPSLGYIKENIQIISLRANRIKNNASLEELKAIVEWMESLS